MSYKYYHPYTLLPVDDEPKSTTLTAPVSYITVPVNDTAVIVRQCELTDECIDRIAEAVVRKLKAGGDGDGV